MRRKLAACVMLVSVIAGCVGDSGGGSNESVEQLVGPEGGTVELVSGAKVEIPPGALSEPVKITITKLEVNDVAALPSNMEPAAKPFAFTPHGQMFLQPVKIEVPYEGDDPETRPMKLPNETASTSMWTTVFPNEKDTTNRKVSMETTSFSVILAAVPRRTTGMITLPDGAVVDVDGGVSGSGGSGGAGSGGSGGTSGSGGAPADAWAARYPFNGAQWNDYVSNNGSSVTNAVDIACDPVADGPGYDGCIHGGEIRALPITGQSSCAGLTISDSLGAFDWTCVSDSDPVQAVSTGLKRGKYLSDLIDPNGTWRPNSIVVRDGSQAMVHTSRPEAWWSNPILIDNDGIALGETTPGTIYIVNQDVSADYAISSSKTGFVVMPGATVTAVNATYGALYLGDPNNSDSVDFSWVEGAITSPSPGRNGVAGNEHRFSMLRHLSVTAPMGTGLSVFCAKSKIVDFQSTDTSTGIQLSAVECTVDGARIQNTGTGIQTSQTFSSSASGPNTIENVVIEGGSTYVQNQAAISIHSQTPGNTLRNITIQNPLGVGMRIDSADNVLSNIAISDSGMNMVDGLVLSGTNNSIDGLTISGGTGRGLVVAYNGHRIQNAKFSRVPGWAIEMGVGSNQNVLSDIVISRSGGGIRLYNSYRNRIWNVMVGNTGDPTYGGEGTGLQTTFSGGTGSEGQRSDNILSNVYLVNNGVTGFELNGSQSNLYQYMTIANTGHVSNLSSSMDPISYGGRGIHLFSSYIAGNSFNNLLLVNNADSGLAINPHITGTAIDWVTGTAFNDIAVIGNGKRSYGSVFGKDIGTGIRLGEFAVGVSFFGHLILADNGIDPEQNCHVFSDSTPKVEGGLTDSSINFSCAPVGGSTASLDTSVQSYGVIGEIQVDDVANGGDTSGAAQQVNITDPDWFTFDNEARMWGPNSSLTLGSGNWGMCPSAGGCRIYDWSLAAANTDVRAVLPLPTGNDVLTHTFWAVDATECAAVPATWTGSVCQSTFLTGAREIMGDGLGNENTLCESGETCLYTPNLGAYQGHGPLVSAGTFTPGVVTGVTLMRHMTNGR